MHNLFQFRLRCQNRYFKDLQNKKPNFEMNFDGSVSLIGISSTQWKTCNKSVRLDV